MIRTACKPWHHESTVSHDAHTLLTVRIMGNSTPMMPWFANCAYHGKQYSHDAMVCEHFI